MCLKRCHASPETSPWFLWLWVLADYIGFAGLGLGFRVWGLGVYFIRVSGFGV